MRDQEPQYGLTVLVPVPGSPSPEPVVDLVFVHGLDGDSIRTWTHEHEEVPWIADSRFLGEYYNKARVMTFGYNANVFENVTTNRVINHANDLLEGLWARRRRCNGRPIVFVVHSLGGIVVKRALILCQDDDRYKDIQSMTRGVIFMGTPHEGSDQASLLGIAQRVVSFFRAGQDMTAITKELQTYSATTMDINKSFMRKASKSLELLCFYETRPVRLPQGERLIVHPASAELNGNDARSVGMSCNHLELCKFESPQSSRFQSVFWPQFEIVVDNAIEYAEARRTSEEEGEEAAERLRSLNVPTTEPTNRANPVDTIQVPSERGATRADLLQNEGAESSADEETSRRTFLASLTGWTAANLAENLLGPQPGTCSWIERNETFRTQWIESPESRLLFITGGGGCGKSCLAKYIREYLYREYPEPNLVLAFFCNNTRINRNESPILQYFIKELILQRPNFFRQVAAKYRSLNLTPNSLHLGSLMDVLKNILRVAHPGKVFLVIDGLDECDPAYVKELLQRFQWMLQDSGPGNIRVSNTARILILCRASQDIDGWRSSHLNINITAEEIKNDIGMLIDVNVERIAASKTFEFDKDMAAVLFKLLAGDSFLWAYNILKDMEQLDDNSWSAIMELVRKCPRDMVQYFSNAIRDLNSSGDELFSVIQNIILFARRPLQVSELREAAGVALAVDLSHFDLSGRIRSTYTKILRINASGEVNFVHYSLIELLLRTKDTAEKHLWMTRLCLIYLLRGHLSTFRSIEQLDEQEREAFIEIIQAQFPFVKYAVEFLLEHIRLAASRIEELIPLLRTLLCDNDYLRAWTGTMVLFGNDSISLTPSVLQLMAYHKTVNLLNLVDIVNSSDPSSLLARVRTWWLSMKAAVLGQLRLILVESVQLKDNNGFTLLHIAALGSCEEFAKLWRVFSNEVDIVTDIGITPLHCASLTASSEFIQLLLSWGANPNKMGRNLRTPLDYAAGREDDAPLKVLLSNGASPISILGLSLGAAIRNGREEQVRLLVQHGADVNRQMVSTEGQMTLPILEAIDIQNDVIFDILLQGADVTSKAGSLGANALHIAVLEKQRDCVQKILAKGCGHSHTSCWNERTSTQGGWSALMIAVSQSDYEIAKLLLENGASPDVARDDGSTALHLAVRTKKLPLCQLLIQHNCEVNRVDTADITALSEACRLPDDVAHHFVATLLSADADCCVEERSGNEGPLHIAVQKGHQSVIDMLLRSSTAPDINLCGKDFPTPLGYAVYYDHVDIVKQLLNAGADVDRLYLDQGSPLLIATKRRNEYIVSILLRHHANRVGERHVNWTPLHHCALYNIFGILKLLLADKPEEIINVTAGKQERYGTPLHQACIGGNFKLAKYLIKNGASLDGRFGIYGSSFLHGASIGGNKYLVNELIQKYTFDKEELTTDGLSPLMLACREGNKKVATLLVHRGADPTQKNSNGDTALLFCATSKSPNYFKISKLLLRTRRFELEIINRSFLTACERGKNEMVDALIERGADPNFRYAQDEWTGLQLAAVRGHETIVERLLRDGRTDMLATDHKKRTVLHLACNLNRVYIIALLLLHSQNHTSTNEPSTDERLLSAIDEYGRTASDYRHLSREDQTHQETRDRSRRNALGQLKRWLDPDTVYIDGDIKFAKLGKALVFLDDDEYALLAYQMRATWMEWDGIIYQEMACTCDNCGPESYIGTARYVCRTCADIDLCEPCHELYKLRRCSERVCTGHTFFRVAKIPDEEIISRFHLPDAEPSGKFQPIRPCETSDPWMAQLRTKYAPALISRSSTGLSDLDIVHLPCIDMFPFSNYRPRLQTALLDVAIQRLPRIEDLSMRRGESGTLVDEEEVD